MTDPVDNATTPAPAQELPVSQIEKATRDVGAHWLAQHGGEPVRLERQDVAEIAFRLIKAHVQPTVEAVRKVNGGSGSPNTIHPALRAFYSTGELEQRFAQPRVDQDLSPPLEAWAEILKYARARLRGELTAELKSVDDGQAALEARSDELDARTRELDVRADAQRETIVRLTSNVEDLSSARDRLQAELANAEKLADSHAAVARQREAEAKVVAETHRQQVESLQRDIGDARRAAKQDADATIRVEAELATTRSALEAVRSERDKARENAAEVELANRGLMVSRDAAEAHLAAATASIKDLSGAHMAELTRRDREHAATMDLLRHKFDQEREARARADAVATERANALREAQAQIANTAQERDELKQSLWQARQNVMGLETRLKLATHDE